MLLCLTSDRQPSYCCRQVRELAIFTCGDVATIPLWLRGVLRVIVGRVEEFFTPFSGLNIEAWRKYLEGYHDAQIVDFLEFGWPISFDRSCPLVSTYEPHLSGREFPDSVYHYLKTELGHKALLGPFMGPPVKPFQASPLMSRPKKGFRNEENSFRPVMA